MIILYLARVRLEEALVAPAYMRRRLAFGSIKGTGVRTAKDFLIAP
jgi:hypothetical protein